ncbi:MAG: alpha/beta hydrolase [Pseudomonadota bacterium]
MSEETYRGMDREALDRQYNARATVPDVTVYVRGYRARTEAAKAELTFHDSVVYGPGAKEQCDIYPVGSAPAPTFVFIHGGYWRLLSKDDSGLMAPALHEAGIATVAVDYALAPAVSLDEIVRQCRLCLSFLHREGRRYGVDPSRIVVGGSSAGGHLTGMMITGDWHDTFGVPEDLVKAALPISPLMDLEPIRLCHVNDWANLDAASAAALSPMHHIGAPPPAIPVCAAVGKNETDEFRRQCHDFAGAWQKAGHPAKSFEVEGRNHFDVLYDLNDPDTALFAALMDLFKA